MFYKISLIDIILQVFKFKKFLRDKNIKQSLSIPDQPCDNAVAESFFDVMKREELSHHWYNSRPELENIIAEYIKFFNEMPLHRKNGMLTPDQFEEILLQATRK